MVSTPEESESVLGKLRYGRLNRLKRKLASERSSVASSVHSNKGTVAPALLAFLKERVPAGDDSESVTSAPMHKGYVQVDAEIIRGKIQLGLPIEPQTQKEMDLLKKVNQKIWQEILEENTQRNLMIKQACRPDIARRLQKLKTGQLDPITGKKTNFRLIEQAYDHGLQNSTESNIARCYETYFPFRSRHYFWKKKMEAYLNRIQGQLQKEQDDLAREIQKDGHDSERSLDEDQIEKKY